MQKMGEVGKMENNKKVAVVGAGFGGLSAAKELCGKKGIDVHVIDRRNYHLFQPLLYQVAMAGLNPSDIAIPIRKLFSRHKNVEVTMAEVDQIDVKNTAIEYDKKWHKYDYIVLACGAKHFYFGNNEWETYAPGLKNIEQATEIRRRVLTAFEFAEKEEDKKAQNAYLTFVIIGGGPTGVEVAGAISEMAKQTLKKDFRNADLTKTKVYLVEAGERVLAAFPKNLSARAQRDLKDLGVEVLTNTRADKLNGEGLMAGDKWIDARTLIWAAGVKPSHLTEGVEAPKGPQGRIKVEKDLSVASNKNVFSIGDMTYLEDEKNNPLPGIAPVAIQQGHFVGKQILRDIKGKERKNFHYWDKGMMATIGRSRAIISSGRFQATGFIAWITWVFIHIMYLMRFRNRVFVFLQWSWSYFRFGYGARLIVHKSWRYFDGKKINYQNYEENTTEKPEKTKDN